MSSTPNRPRWSSSPSSDWLGDSGLVSSSDLPYSSRTSPPPPGRQADPSPTPSPHSAYNHSAHIADDGQERIYPGDRAQTIAEVPEPSSRQARADEADDELELSPTAPMQEVDLSRPDTSPPPPQPIPIIKTSPPKGARSDERASPSFRERDRSEDRAQPSQPHSTRFATQVQEHPNDGRYVDDEDDIALQSPQQPPQFTNKDSGFSPVQRPGFSRASSFASDAESDRGEGDDDVLYDWDDEEDLVDTEAKFEAQMGLRRDGKKKWGVKRIATLLFSSLVGSTFLSACLVAVPLCVHFLWEKPNPTEHRQYVSDNISAWFYFAAFNVSVSWFLAVAVDLIPTLVTGVVHIFWGEVQESFKTHVETFSIMKGWIKPILYAASVWGSWTVIFGHIFLLYDVSEEGDSRAAYTPRMYQVIELLFFAMLIYCVEKLILQFIALSFHRTAYRDRLTEINYHISVLDRLNLYRPKRKEKETSYSNSHLFSHKHHRSSGSYEPSHSTTALNGMAPDADYPQAQTSRPSTPTFNPATWGRAFAPSVKSSGKDRDRRNAERLASEPRETSNSLDELRARESERVESMAREEDALESQGKAKSTHTGHGRSRAGSEPDHPSGFAKVAKGVRGAVLHDARNVKGKDQSGANNMAFSVANPKAAKALAKLIYTSYKPVGAKRSYLVPSDFYCAYGTEKEAEAAFKVFDKDGNGDISRSEVKTLVLKTYKERRFLAKSMQDVGNAVKSLNKVLMAFAFVILFFIALSVLGVEIGTQLTSLYSILLGLSFIFKSAASNVFDSIVYLFVTHAYDSGDRVFIGNENLVVKEMGIFSTTFIRVDGTLATYYNSILFGMKVINVRRSDNMVENMTLQVGWHTTEKQLDDLEKAICTWLSTDEKRDIGASTAIMYQHIDFMRSIELTILIPHLATWQDWGERWARRTRFHAAVKHYMEQLDITCHNSPMPVHMLSDTPDIQPRGSLTSELRSPLSRNLTRNASRRRPSTRSDMPPPPSPSGGRGDVATEPMKQTLGFLPPADERGVVMTMRKRKGGSRKALLALSS